MDLVSYHTDHGMKTALIAERGRKWMTVIMMHPDPRTHKVRLTEEQFMTPIVAKKVGRTYRRGITSATTMRVKRLLRGLK